jgi:hypothetical protein
MRTETLRHHLCIPKDALTRRDFTRVWANMQFM